MSDAGDTTEEVVVDASDAAFSKAVREAVRPLLVGLGVLIAAVAVFGGIAIGALIVQARDNAQTRAEGQVRTCGSDQYFEIHHNALVQTNQNSTVRAYAPVPKPNPADQFVKDYEKTKVPVRGCSKKAVAAYIKWRTEHPTAVDCATDEHGYCKTPPVSTP